MQASAFSKALTRKSPIILDGGLSAELGAQGFELDSVLWCADLLRTHPRAIVAAHRAYLDAGAEIVISASYQASRAGFHQFGVASDDADRLIASSVSLARQACDEFAAQNPAAAPRFVAASVGPYGAVLNDGSEYVGRYGVSEDTLRLFHEQRLRLLDGAGADVLACETIPSHAEARVLAGLLADAATPAWMSFACKDGAAICDGTRIEDACATFREHPRVLALGVNCTPPQFVVSLIEKIRSAAPGKAVVVYPNSGERFVAGENRWTGTATIDDVADAVRAWRDAGANIIGGCCRIGPDAIRALAAALQQQP